MTQSDGSLPDPEAAAKPDTPAEMAKPSWSYALKRTIHEFLRDECTDQAAGLTYFTVLSVFPALLAVVSILGVAGQGAKTTHTLLSMLSKIGAPSSAIDLLRGPLTELGGSQGAGLALIVGIAGAVWSASGYVRGFGRAMNRIYGVGEGRPFWKLYPVMLLVTICVLAIAIVMVGILILSGSVAEQIGSLVGLGGTTLLIWNIAKWPILLALVVLVITVLYSATPNVRQPKLRWFSIGAIVAIVVMALATAGFGFYVSNFASYNATYGAIGGVIVLLLWIWIMNVVLLFGAEFNVETERSRQLQAGIPAEKHIQLPPRDTRKIEKSREKDDEIVDDGREHRLES